MNVSNDSIFRILDAVNRFEMKQRRLNTPTPKHKLVNRFRHLLWILPISISLLIAAIDHFLNFEWLKITSIVILLLAYPGVIVDTFISAWIHRKYIRKSLRYPYGLLLQNASATAVVDSKYLPILEKKSLPALEVVALELKSEREFFERRISLLVGAIEKVGLVPGLLATFLSLNKLSGTSNQLILSLAYATPALYFLGVTAHFESMRLERQCKLLDLVIARKKVDFTSLTKRKVLKRATLVNR